MVRRTQKRRINRKSTRKNRKQHGGVKVYKFDEKRLNNLIKKIAQMGNPKYCPDNIGSLEPDNTNVSVNKLDLAGRGASGSEDACRFTLDQKTGEITFETIGIADNEEAGNEWLKTKDNILTYLKASVLVSNNNA